LLLGVDDSKTMRRVLEITFAGENYRTVFAGTASDAIEKLGSERPNVVLVDASLEGLNGYELCERIKSSSPGVPVILLSSKQQPYDRNRGGQVGADDHIDKPFDTQQLIDKVNAALKKSAGAGSLAAPAAAPPANEPARPRAQTLAYGQQVNSPSSPAPVAMPPAQPRAAYAAPVAQQPAPAPVPSRSSPSARPSASPSAFTVNGQLADKLVDLGLTAEQVAGVLLLSREIVEKVVWEVVPVLAETMIREEIKRLTND
jgi:CheY-like chemotaxis protein